jgi:hypothetical protein
MPKPKITAAQWRQIIKRYQAGEASTGIAADYNVSASSICGGLTRRGIHLRTRLQTILKGRKPLTKKEQGARYYAKHGKRIRSKRRSAYHKNPEVFKERSRTRVGKQAPKGVNSKECKNCKTIKPFSNFGKRRAGLYGLRPRCKECEKEASRQYREANPEKIRASLRRYRLNTPKEKLREIRNRSIAKSMLKPEIRLKSLLRKHLHQVLKHKGIRKQESALKLVGCSVAKLKQHLEAQFAPGMTWENRGILKGNKTKVWHVDHIAPLASFDLRRKEQRQKAFHYTNLRPLWGLENIAKSNRT